MAQPVSIYVTDDSDLPVEGARVTLHNSSTGQSYYQDTNVDGLAFFGAVDEAVYTLGVVKADYISPAAVKISVAVPPDPTPAHFNPPVAAAYASIDGTRKYVKLEIDNAGAVEVDVAGVDDVVTAPTEIASAINAALGAAIAEEVLGKIKLTSTTLGSSSSVKIFSDGTVGPSDIEAEDATELVFGLPTGFGSIELLGEDTPLDYNDYSLVMTEFGGFVSTKPYACMLWARFWRHELHNDQTPAPLKDRTVWIEILDRPKTIVPGVDVGDSFYVTTDENGYMHFELTRGTRARMYLQWLDKYVDFTVPDKASANLDAYLSPYVLSMTITEPVAPVGLTVGQESHIAVDSYMSDGSIKGALPGLVLTSSDSNVVSVEGTTITAVAIGSAAITASIINDKGVEIVSEPLLLEVSA